MNRRSLCLLLACAAILPIAGCADLQRSVSDTVAAMKDLSEPIPAEKEKPGGITTAERILNKGACPVVEITPDLATWYEFPDPSNTSDEDALMATATLRVAESRCFYAPKSMTVDARIAIEAVAGPAMRASANAKSTVSYPYFVAILSPSNQILAKQVFSAPLSFDADKNNLTHFEAFRQIVPITNQENGAQHKITFGFQLSREQLTYNRALIQKTASESRKKRIEQNRIIREHAPQESINPPVPVTVGRTPPPNPTQPLEGGPIILSPEDMAPKNQNDQALSNP